MGKLTNEQIVSVKAKGFLHNRGTELFSGRIVAPGTVFTADNLVDMAYIAKNMGNGSVIATSRLTVELPGIPYEKIEEAIRYAEEHDLHFGGTGAKIRPVTACKGTTCVYGNFDTQGLAKKIHEEYYIGWSNVSLPHKFKIAVGGCPNSCMKPSLNDFGIEGHKVPEYHKEECKGCKVCAVEKSCPVKCVSMQDGKMQINRENCKECGVCVGKCPFKAVRPESETKYQLFFGGTWGKKTRMGTPLNRLVSEEEIQPILEKAMLWFRENAYQKERFGLAIDRIGFDKLEEAINSDEILARKEEILAAPIKTRG